ncbi:alpha/beta hydrolase [Stagnimonas aquatica]|uniref:Alpha/beta hydrolase n=1 Tax=Stagnimonas aquatica TaxID=2689987 RepID=A0A3N0VGH8_9GAMM|nr:alpha/beta hydrolase [Stagnimonas aquatica]ROH91877.1 alpha/beta hydrolase [Stagnimonas aquatica]
MSQTPWILLRGLMRDQRHWGDFPALFQAQFPGARLLTPDLPGNGQRNREESPARVEAMADLYRTELRRQGIAPPYRLFGMSLGAMVAVAWSSAYPAEVESCVLSNTSLRPVSPFYHRLRPVAYPLLLRQTLREPSPAAAERAVLDLTSRHHERTRQQLPIWTEWRRSHPVSRANGLRQLGAAIRFRAPASAPAVPLLLLCGAGDRLVSPRCSQALAALWRAPLRVHPSAGHDLPLDDGEWVAQQIGDWERQRLAAGADSP